MRTIRSISVFAIAGMLALALVTATPIAAQDRTLDEELLDDLDKLIDEQKKNRKKSGGAGGGQQNAPRPRQTPNQQPQTKPGDKPSNKPATTSSERPQGNGEAEKVNMDRMRVVIKKLWGELPQHQREQMLQLPIEEFLPKYQTMIEEYFRRLAEEKE